MGNKRERQRKTVSAVLLHSTIIQQLKGEVKYPTEHLMENKSDINQK
jgi:hypothetical protein